MKIVIDYSMGQPRLHMGIYCGRMCGAGCTKQQFDAAKAEAEELVVALGDHWTGRVWENLGWHAEVAVGSATVTKCGRGRDVHYRFDSGTCPQFVACAASPVAAVKSGCDKMLAHSKSLVADCEKLTDSLFPSAKPRKAR